MALEGDAHINIYDLDVGADALWIVGERWPPDDDGLWTEGDSFARPWVARLRRE